MLVSFRLMAFAALLTAVSYSLSQMWAVLNTLLGPSAIAYLIFLVTTFALMTVMNFVLSLLGIFADGRLTLSE